MMQGTALVTGASGALGYVLVESLLRSGKRVRVLTRRPIGSDYFSLPIDSVLGDIADRNTVTRAAAGMDVVFHLAALLHVTNPDPALRAEYKRVNVEGTQSLVEAAKSEGVSRLVFFSTIAVYGSTAGRISDEMTQPCPDGPYAETKLIAENIALDARSSSGEQLACVLRLAAVYGPRMKGNYRRLAHSVARGRFVPIGDGCNRRTLIHEHDVAHAAILAAEHAQSPGKIFNVTDGRIHSVKDILGAICSGLDRQPPAWRIPVGLAKFGGMLADLALFAAGRKNISMQTMLIKYLEDVAISGAKFQHDLGFRPRYDLLAGWQQTVAAMKSSGEL